MRHWFNELSYEFSNALCYFLYSLLTCMCLRSTAVGVLLLEYVYVH